MICEYMYMYLILKLAEYKFSRKRISDIQTLMKIFLLVSTM